MDDAGGVAIGGGERGVSTVVGLVLLVGVVTVGSIGILVVGGSAVSETSDRATEERVTGTFRQFDQRTDSVVTGGDARAVVETGGDETFQREAGGRVVVTVTEPSGTREVANESLDALVYDDADTHIAYQSGAVWRGTGRDATIVSPPETDYQARGTGSGTLTLALTALTGDRAFDGGGLAATVTDATAMQSAVVGTGTVTVRVEGPYYAAWGEYFTALLGPTGVSVDHANRTTEAQFLSLPPVAASSQNTTGVGFGNVVRAAGAVAAGNGSADIVGPIAATGSIAPQYLDGDDTSGASTPLRIDPVIRAKVTAAEENPGQVTTVAPDLGGVGTLENGTVYYAPDGIELTAGDNAIVDLTNGSVTLIVDGDVTVRSGQLDVLGGTDDEAFRVYATGDLSLKNGHICHGAACDRNGTDHVQVYGTSEMQVALWGGNPTVYEGTVYAPRAAPVDGPNTAYDGSNGKCDLSGTDDYDTCVTTGNAQVYGSIVGGETLVSQSVAIEYDQTLDSVEPKLITGELPLPPTLNYLHVETATIAVTEAD